MTIQITPIANCPHLKSVADLMRAELLFYRLSHVHPFLRLLCSYNAMR